MKKLERSPRALENEKTGMITAWVYDMQGHAGTCAEKYWEAIGKNVHTPRKSLHIDDHQLSREDFETRRELKMY